MQRLDGKKLPGRLSTDGLDGGIGCASGGMTPADRGVQPTRRRMLLLAGAALVAGCSNERLLVGAPSIGTGLSRFPDQTNLTTADPTDARVFFVTDRAPSEDGSYGSGRARAVSYGEVVIGIGDADTSWGDLIAQDAAGHPLNIKAVEQRGQLPASPLPFGISNGRPVVVPEARSAYDGALADLQDGITRQLQALQTGDVLLHVPGVNTSFEDGVFSMTDLWHHTGRNMVPVLYSWPSGHGGLPGYFTDRESGEFTIFHLKEFMRSLYQNPNVNRIHIVAHSRGTDIATSALRELLIETRAQGLSPRSVFKIENLILAAPDLNFDIVGQRLVSEQFGSAFGRISVYMNQEDTALNVAQRLMVGARLGRLEPEDVPQTEQVIFGNVERVNFIRVANAGGAFGHSYYRENPMVLSDIVLLLNTCSPPGSATRPLERQSGNFWLLSNTYSGGGSTISGSCS